MCVFCQEDKEVNHASDLLYYPQQKKVPVSPDPKTWSMTGRVDLAMSA